MTKNQAKFHAILNNYNNSKIIYSSAYACACNSFPLHSAGNFEIRNFNSSQTYSSYQASALTSYGQAKICFSQFIECGPDNSGATVETYDVQSNFTMSNFINMSSICFDGGFLTIGRALLFMDSCFIEIPYCQHFFAKFREDDTEHITITNSNIIAKISINHEILDTQNVNTFQERGDLTFADIIHVSLPSCNYSVYDCTCELNAFVFNHIHFFLLFEIFIFFGF